MKIFYGLTIVMNITLIILLWVYIFDLYIQDRLNGFEYTSKLFHSDQAIPIIGLGIILNTGGILYAMIAARRQRLQEIQARGNSPSPRTTERVSRQAEIEVLEGELQHIKSRLEELRKLARQDK